MLLMQGSFLPKKLWCYSASNPRASLLHKRFDLFFQLVFVTRHVP